MKALSLTQPWATLVMIGAKKIETRHGRFPMSHRGPLLIHASKTFPRDCRRLCGCAPFADVLRSAGLLVKPLPVGVLLGTVDVVHSWKWCGAEVISEQERAFGHYEIGRVMTRLENPRPFPEPVPYRGSLGLFEVPDAIVQAARALEVAS